MSSQVELVQAGAVATCNDCCFNDDDEVLGDLQTDNQVLFFAGTQWYGYLTRLDYDSDSRYHLSFEDTCFILTLPRPRFFTVRRRVSQFPLLSLSNSAYADVTPSGAPNILLLLSAIWWRSAESLRFALARAEIQFCSCA